jgi:methylmalonyl-CoA mutase N-terminal domain/subunit
MSSAPRSRRSRQSSAGRSRCTRTRSTRRWVCPRPRPRASPSELNKCCTTTVDPLAGSYYVETLTETIHRGALEELATIDALGGTLVALEAGYQPDAIGDAAYDVQRAVEAGDRIIVGVNAFTDEGEEQRPAPQRIDPDLERRQVERTHALRARRDPAAATAALAALTTTASGSENVLPRIRAAVEADVTLGEIANALRGVWGEYRP